MTTQNFMLKNEELEKEFFHHMRKKKGAPRRLALSWSNWGFGRESLEVSAARLAKNGVRYIELHGNHYGADIGYRPDETRRILEEHEIKVSGVCGMFSRQNDLSSPDGAARQQAIDYIRREVTFAREIGGTYLLVVPGAVGRPLKYDDCEFERSVETLRMVADSFVEAGIQTAIEPIRAAETSFCHTVGDAKKYLQAVNHPGVRHINGDVFHMQAGEPHIASAIREAGDALVNLHMADSNRMALGEGSMDIDAIIMALYLLDYNVEGRFVSPEPLGPGGDPYPAMHGKPDSAQLDEMVHRTVTYFRERERQILESI